jgi:glutaredoxin 3
MRIAMPDVTIYTTAKCPYCRRAKALLRAKNLAFAEIAVDGDPEARREMTARAHGRKTVPQIFFNGVHIGDCDDLHELDRRGKLEQLLAGLPR